MGERVVIGIDGGGTKTEAVIMDASGHVRGSGLAGSSNHNNVGAEAAGLALRQVCQQALDQAGATFSDVMAICLCLAGAGRPHDRELVAKFVRAIHDFPRVIIHTDAVGALAAGTGRLLGLVLIAGTGTIALGYDRSGRSARAAGYGALLADYGGGFWIGMDALHAIVCAADGRGPATALTERVLGHLGLAAPDGLVAWTYGQAFGWQRFAALAPLVSEAASAGDAVALDILNGAAHHLADSALAVVRRLDLQDEPFDLVLSGSVWQAGELVQAPLRAAVLAAAPHAHFLLPTRTPAVGAALLAWEEVCRGTNRA
ncbi:MAG: BadF/BadG/BcrA/BcrD ATPase family protein [Chloroflexota bacterium]